MGSAPRTPLVSHRWPARRPHSFRRSQQTQAQVTNARTSLCFKSNNMGNPFRLKFPKAPEPAQPGLKGVPAGASAKAQGCGARLKPEIAEENRRRQRFRLCSPAVFSCFTHPHHAGGCSAQGTEALGSKTCSEDRTGMQSLSTVVLSLGMTGQRR